MSARPSLLDLVRITWGAFFAREERHRYECRHTLLSGIARLWQLRVYNKNLYWFTDQEYLEAWRAFPEGDGKVHDRKFVLLQLAKWAARLPGDTAECGVFNGGSSYLICYARARYAPDRVFKHYAFDSFEGLSAPARQDAPEQARTFRWRPHDLRVPEERARRNLSQFPFVEIYKGWIPETFHHVSDRHFSLVHLDVDLYQPTRDSLEFFYPRLVEGGMLICDDYGSEACPGARQACDEFAKGTPHPVIHLPTGQGVLIKLPSTTG